jgi:triacylglycerol lipase
MGGLDARYAISALGMHSVVRVLITIGTPHRGSALADLATAGPAKTLRQIAARLGYRSDAIDWLTTESLERFNADVLDHPDVAYYSVVGRSAVRELWRNPLLLGSHLFLRRGGGANDGLVTVESQRWGETLEEIDANHFAQIGWSLRFRATALYLRLLRRIKDVPVAEPPPADLEAVASAPAVKEARSARARRPPEL